MKVVMLQTDICWAKSDENVRHAQQLMTDAPATSMYCLKCGALGLPPNPKALLVRNLTTMP